MWFFLFDVALLFLGGALLAVATDRITKANMIREEGEEKYQSAKSAYLMLTAERGAFEEEKRKWTKRCREGVMGKRMLEKALRQDGAGDILGELLDR